MNRTKEDYKRTFEIDNEIPYESEIVCPYIAKPTAAYSVRYLLESYKGKPTCKTTEGDFYPPEYITYKQAEDLAKNKVVGYYNQVDGKYKEGSI